MGGRPMVLVGASLGGAIALDFAHEFPEAVKKLVLIDAQGFIDGSGPGASLPAPLAKLGISVLGSKPLRSLANQMSYTDKSLATEDAVRVGRLHTMCDGWADASLQYMSSGGFAVSTKVSSINQETLVLWGRQDRILDPKLYAERPNPRLLHLLLLLMNHPKSSAKKVQFSLTASGACSTCSISLSTPGWSASFSLALLAKVPGTSGKTTTSSSEKSESDASENLTCTSEEESGDDAEP
ncbi:unnamed protein product [Ectocarpus sp. CCAP 1310/34]|nr:unnamed protein product [Ectocarpus sp. CCAP 1310/34]